MNVMKMARTLALLSFLLWFVFAGQPPAAIAQSSANAPAKAAPAKPSVEHTPVATGAIPLPPVRPVVDQLGPMAEDLSEPDKAGLFLVLFLQVGFLVLLALALFMHWPLFGKSH